jgi:outer membrane protein OmpA-like peptidoglycan-associated protein
MPIASARSPRTRGAPFVILAIAALALVAGCAARPDLGRSRMGAPGIGAIGGGVGGYLVGDLVDGRHARGTRVAGAGIVPLAGAQIGAYMDRQERELRERTDGTDVRVTRQGDDLLLDLPSGVAFAYRSAIVQPGFRHTLDQVAGIVARDRQTYVDVYGHTDAVGGDAYNQALSEQRAGAVAALLEADGVQPARVATRGFGRTRPVASNEAEDGRAANRRVEIRLVPVRQGDAGS